MEGGLTRQRAYLWLSAALLTTLLAAILAFRHPSPTPQVNVVSEESKVEHPQDSYQPKVRNSHYTQSKAKQFSTHTPQPISHAVETPPTTVYHKDKQLLFNLNTADSLDLVQLYNIGPAFANRIIRYRARLVGFADKQQLWEVYGMDSARYNDIAPHLFVNPDDITKLDLNQVSFDRLKRHPYLDYYQAKAIVRLRESAGPFHQIQDILNIPIIDKETFTHIAPYLSCNSQPNK